MRLIYIAAFVVVRCQLRLNSTRCVDTVSVAPERLLTMAPRKCLQGTSLLRSATGIFVAGGLFPIPVLFRGSLKVPLGITPFKVFFRERRMCAKKLWTVLAENDKKQR